MSGRLHLASNFKVKISLELWDLDKSKYYNDENKVQQEEYSLICDNRQEEESDEPACILLRKKIIFSLGISPEFPSELWCGIKFGKLAKCDLNVGEVIA